MNRGRPPLGPDLVESLDLPEEQKQRLRVMLQSVAGELTGAEAAEQLGISESRFYELRKRALVGAGQSLAPRPRGRPVEDQADRTQIDALEHRVDQLQTELDIAQLRAALAEARPAPPSAEQESAHQKKRRAAKKHKRKEQKRRRKQKRR